MVEYPYKTGHNRKRPPVGEQECAGQSFQNFDAERV